MVKLAIITTHPIQYNAPVFRLLTSRGKITVKVFYTSGEESKFDKGFGKKIRWDVPLLEGYDYCLVENRAVDRGSHHYKGIDNPSLIKEIEEWGAEAILIYGWKFRSHLKAIRHFKTKIPVIFRGDSTLLDEQPGVKQWLRRMLLTWVYKHIDLALYTGKNNKQYYLAHGLKEHQLQLAPHAVDNERFGNWTPEQENSLQNWRKELGIKEEEFIILYAGKLLLKKNPQLLVALGKALNNYGDIRMLIVGNGDLEKELKEALQKDRKFIFLDFQNQQLMPLIYRLADVFILPSKGPGETWGLALNEAMACGLPVMASEQCGGAVDLIKEGENGIIFSPQDIEKVKKYVMELYCEPLLKERAGQASQERIKNFNFAAITAAIEGACSQ